MRRLVPFLAALLLASAGADAGDAKKSGDGVLILTDQDSGTTIGRVGGEKILLQKTPDGMVGRMGQDKIILHRDGQGNTIGKVGDKKLFCHRDPDTGLSFCK
jgi:hypothetical protein